MTMKQLVNSMMNEAYMAGAAADAGNITKAAYWYGEFMAHRDIVTYDDIVKYTTIAERSKAIKTIQRISDKVLEAIK